MRYGGNRAGGALLRALALHWESLLVVALIVLVGAQLARFKIAACADIPYAGHSDEIAYITMGQNLLAGRGLDVDWVSYFFIPYPRTITHREDHWPPFLSFLHVPIFAMYGSAPPATRIAPIIVGTILFPLSGALLAMALSRRAYAGLIAATALFAQPLIFAESVRGYADIAHAAVLALFFWAIILAARYRWMHLLAGVFAAFAFYAKGSELMLLPLYPVLAILAGGLKSIKARWPWLGLLTATLLVAPWLVSNYRQFGHPLHSTQNYVAGYIGLDDWEAKSYAVYWGHSLPTLSNRWNKYGDHYHDVVAQNTDTFCAQSLLGPEAKPTEWSFIEQHPAIDQWREPISNICGLITLHAGTALLIGTPFIAAAMLIWRRNKRIPVRWRIVLERFGHWIIGGTILAGLIAVLCINTSQWKPVLIAALLLSEWAAIYLLRQKSTWGPLLMLGLVLGAHWAFMVYFWEIISRFAYLFLPATAAVAATAIVRLCDIPLVVLIPHQIRWWRGTLTVIALIGAGIFLHAFHENWQNLWRTARDPISKQMTYDYRAHPKWPGQISSGKTLDELSLGRRLSAFVASRSVAAVLEMNHCIAYYHARPTCVTAGPWIAAHLPDAVIMARNPWELKYCSGPMNKTVEIPKATPEQIFDIARYYGVKYLLVDYPKTAEKDRGLAEYETGRKPGMTRVPGTREPLFELHLDLLPGNGNTLPMIVPGP